MTTTSRMGRPPALTREMIAHAVIEIGFADLTVAAVRERLGVGQTTLYRYVADRDELVRIGIGYLLKHAPWPSRDGAWRDVLSRHAMALWHLWEAHPGSATEVARGVYPLAGVRIADDLCAVLLRQGFTPANAILACDIVFDMVTDNRHALEHYDFTGESVNAEHVPDRYPNQIESKLAHPATDGERQIIHAEIQKAFVAQPSDWFANKLRVVLDGVEHSLAPQPRDM